MIREITNLVNEVKSNLFSEINKSIIYVYWNIGKIIVSNENEFNNRLEYGKEVLKGLSTELTKYLDLYDLLYIKVNVKIHKLLASGRIVAEKLPERLLILKSFIYYM